ncbi:MAG: hypothetical protein NWR03_14140 [Akkermansiaceae bacterium]|jgi:hypothetical protein|nr:hypothetical protein [Akkermansiaceae bacterium]MDP4898905.1 hypothetical protein [Akkermansiaceae bacterium]
MAKDEDKKKEKGGCLGKLLGLIVIATIAGLGASIYFVTQPQDLTDLQDSPAEAGRGGSVRDIKTVLEKSIQGDHSVRLTEKELNRWLASELDLTQGGELGANVSLKRVWVRLREGVAEIIFEREVAGYPMTTSMFLQVEQLETGKGMRTNVHLHGGGYSDSLPIPTRGGRFGKLVVPQGFLTLVLPDFEKLAAVFETEIELGFEKMARIKIEDKALVLDPSPPKSNANSGGPRSF